MPLSAHLIRLDVRPSIEHTLGGGGDDFGLAIAVDPTGHAYVTGQTRSPDFNTVNPIQQQLAGGIDAFVAKVKPNGTELAYSTYLGGREDEGWGIAADSSGCAYGTGRTDSIYFPTTNRVVQPVAAGASDAFVSKFNPTGSALVYSTYLGGGSELDERRGIVIDSRRDAYCDRENRLT